MADVGHAGADKDLVDLVAGHLGQQLGVVRVVGAADDGLGDLVQVDLDHGVVVGVRVRFHQLRILQPGFHGLGATLQGAWITVAFVDH